MDNKKGNRTVSRRAGFALAFECILLAVPPVRYFADDQVRRRRGRGHDELRRQRCWLSASGRPPLSGEPGSETRFQPQLARQSAAWARGLLRVISSVVFAAAAWAQTAQAPEPAPNVANPGNPSSADTTNQSNNVLTPVPQLLFQNFFMPSVSEFPGRVADEELIRVYWPFKVAGVQNVFRIYPTIFTYPLHPKGRNAGLGDILVYDLALKNVGKFTLGAGPLMVIPAASHENMGSGKWQAGAAGSIVTETSWGLLGTIVTYSHSFSGYGSGRPPTQIIGVEPLAFYNLNKKGWYLRSSGIWNINYGDHNSVIPAGFGFGKVTKLRSGTVMNLNIEPQRAVHHTGPLQPRWQILMAANFEFPEWTKPKASKAGSGKH